MSFLDIIPSYLGPGYHEGVTDLLGVVRASAPIREGSALADPSQIRVADLIAAETFSFDIDQKSTGDTRYAGEGAETNSLWIQNARLRSSVRMPLYAPVHGFVDPAFATLWDACRWAFWGTATSAAGFLQNPSGNTKTPSGSYSLIVSNIADFTAIPTPFSITINDAAPETATVIAVSKRLSTLHLLSPTSVDHAAGLSVFSFPDFASSTKGPVREPSFCLFSLREGLLAPTLVNKIEIEAKVGESVQLTIEFASLNLLRDPQITMRALKDTLLLQWSRTIPPRIINSYETSLSPASARAGAFGLKTALGHPWFAGFQGLEIPNLTVEGISISIDNRLEEVYGLHSLQTGANRQFENSNPWAIYSQGRTISGKISYKSPLEPLAVAERLAGPSALANGGLIIDFGSCSITLPEIAWHPASEVENAEGEQERSLEWTMVAESRLAMPELAYSTQM